MIFLCFDIQSARLVQTFQRITLLSIFELIHYASGYSVSLSPEEDTMTMNLHRHENLKSFISPGQISLLQPYEQNQLISQRTHLLAEIDVCGYKLCFQIKLIELGVVMGTYRLPSSKESSAISTGDQEGMAQIRNVVSLITFVIRHIRAN